MAMTWAKIVSALLGLIKPLMYFLIYLGGKKAAFKEVEAEQAKKDAELNAGYAEDLARRPEPGESTGGMRRGDWPT